MRLNERNSRERLRMQQVNECYLQLRQLLPYKKKRNTRVPKELILRLSARYIQSLANMIAKYDKEKLQRTCGGK